MNQEENNLKITFKDVSKRAYNKLCKKNNFNNSQLPRSKSLNNINDILSRVSPILGKLQMFTKFETTSRDIWSCIFWRARKDLEREIEILIRDVLRIWKTDEGQIMCSTQPVTGMVTWFEEDDELVSRVGGFVCN
jgi:hypothetical protein